MVYFKTLSIKLIAIAITVLSLFGIFYHASIFSLVWISLLTTGISFIVGDLLILRYFGNVVASIVDFPLTFLSLLLLSGLFIETSIPIAAIAFMGAFFVTFCEPFIHAYLTENLEAYPDYETPINPNQTQTEFSEEMDPDDKVNNEKNSDKDS